MDSKIRLYLTGEDRVAVEVGRTNSGAVRVQLTVGHLTVKMDEQGFDRLAEALADAHLRLAVLHDDSSNVVPLQGIK